MADETMIRSFGIQGSAQFILDDAELSQRIDAPTRERLRGLVAKKYDTWSPRAEAMYLWDLIDKASPDEATAYRNLVRCGEALADIAIATFMRLILKLLSPTQFAKRFPSIWEHDHKGGHALPGVMKDKTMVIQVNDVEGFRHIAPICVGFIGVALRATGLKDLKLECVTWSRAAPGQPELRVNASWS